MLTGDNRNLSAYKNNKLHKPERSFSNRKKNSEAITMTPTNASKVSGISKATSKNFLQPKNNNKITPVKATTSVQNLEVNLSKGNPWNYQINKDTNNIGSLANIYGFNTTENHNIFLNNKVRIEEESIGKKNYKRKNDLYEKFLAVRNASNDNADNDVDDQYGKDDELDKGSHINTISELEDYVAVKHLPVILLEKSSINNSQTTKDIKIIEEARQAVESKFEDFSKVNFVELVNLIKAFNSNLSRFTDFTVTQKEELCKDKVNKGKVYFDGATRTQILELFNLLRFNIPEVVETISSLDENLQKRYLLKAKPTNDILDEYYQNFGSKFG